MELFVKKIFLAFLTFTTLIIFTEPVFAVTFTDPWSFPSIRNLVESFLRHLSYVVFPAVIVLFVWIGYSFIYAGGDSGKISSAKDWFVWAIMATLVVLGLLVIFTIGNTLLRSILEVVR